MSVRSHQSSNSPRQQMEQSIDRLAEVARKGIAPTQFFSDLLDCALSSGGADRAILWNRSLAGKWQVAGEAPSGVPREIEFVDQRQQVLDEASKSEGPYLLKGQSGAAHSTLDDQSSAGTEILSPIRHSTGTVGILETRHQVKDSEQLPSDTLPFFSALCEVTADFLAQQELEQLRRARLTWHQWDEYSQSLWHSLDLSSVCMVIANDGRLLAGSDRVSVLVRRGRSYVLKSVSGVSNVEPRSSTTRSLETLAELTAQQGHSIWYQPANNELQPDNSDIFASLHQYVLDSSGKGIGIVPISFDASANERSRPLAIIILETFHPLEDFLGWKSRGEMLAARSTPALRSACERSEIPWLGLWQSFQRGPGNQLSPSTAIGLAFVTVVVAALVLIPADFTVTGTAELWPAHRRELFATSTGIVDRILVAHGDDVTKDQPLVILRDPELESDAPRILGEIATLSERLKGVQAARFIGNNAPDGTSRARQLTADEEELKERLQTLERQRALIEERINGLTLCSPIAGKILTWDIAQLLLARPVERGQTLLTIGEIAGPWIVEVRIPDKEAGHLLRARKAGNPELAVDFLLTSEPGHVYHGRVQDVALSCESDDASRSQVRVVVGMDRDQIDQPRAGATAIPRIHCGRRSLGYVWLHDFIDAIRTRLLF